MLRPDERAPLSPVDITTMAFAHDAIRGYDEMRRAGPVVWQRSTGSFLPTGYADSAAVLRSRDFVAADLSSQWRSLGRKLGRDYTTVIKLLTYMPFLVEAERHTELRRAFATGIAPFAGGHPSFKTQIQRKLSRARQDGGMDLATDFASHLLFDIFCDLMKITDEGRSLLRPLATMSWILEGTSPMRRRDTVAQQIEVCFSHLHKHVAELVAEADDGFIGRAFHALPPDEDDPAGAVAAIACVILIMGNDAVGSCLTNGVQKLKTEDSHPVAQSDWESIADDAMRYVAPIDFMNRIAARDTIIAGCPVAKGERVLVSPLCANHDTAEFGDLTASITVKPDKNIGLTFGAGSHVCVGNRFSRTVIRLAFAGLAELPELSIAGEAVRGAGKVVRTVVSLPVQFQ